MEDVDVRGYRIPKGTLIIPNLHALHHSQETWGDPENFRPERFLSDDGQLVKRHESLVLFSVGKRVCIGETMARDQIYLFLTNILYKFQILPDNSVSNPEWKPAGAFILEPKHYNVIFKERAL
jgi:cytochrome P450